MSWTGQINTVTKNADGLTLTMQYQVTDGVTTEHFTEPFVSDPDSCEKIVLDKVNHLNAVDAQAAEIAAFDPSSVVGPVAPPATAPPLPPDPTLKFAQDLKAYSTVKNKVTLGLDGKTSADVAAAAAVLQGEYTPECDKYLGGALF